jgi:hypothetical protein
MANLSEVYTKVIESRLQKNFNPPWAKPRQQADLESLITQLSDKLQESLTNYVRESTPENLARIVVFSKQLKLLGYCPTIIGERKTPLGVMVIRQDIWERIQSRQEVGDANTTVSNDVG